MYKCTGKTGITELRIGANQVSSKGVVAISDALKVLVSASVMQYLVRRCHHAESQVLIRSISRAMHAHRPPLAVVES